MKRELLFKTKAGAELWENQNEETLDIKLTSKDLEAIRKALTIDATSNILTDKIAAEQILWAIYLFGIEKED